MRVPLVFFLSAGLLHSVSAGGVYCAKTARARAAALGLEYPGVHGAPDLYGPAHHGRHPDTMPFRARAYSADPVLADTEPSTAFGGQNQLGVRSHDDGTFNQAHLRRSQSTFLPSHNTYSPVRSEYTTDQALSFPRGWSVINRKSSFDEVKHGAPPTLSEAPGQPDLVNRGPQGRTKPLSFVYNEHNLAVDESVPNRRGMSLSGLPLPHGRGHGTNQRGLSGYGLGREVPVLGLPLITDRHRVGAPTSRGPAVGGLKRIRFPVHLAQPWHRNLNVKRFVRGNPVSRHLTKPKSGPVRITW